MKRSKAKRRSAGLLNPSNITRQTDAVVASAPCHQNPHILGRRSAPQPSRGAWSKCADDRAKPATANHGGLSQTVRGSSGGRRRVGETIVATVGADHRQGIVVVLFIPTIVRLQPNEGADGLA